MNSLLLISYVLRSFCLTDSPYFYDKALDQECLKKVTTSIKEACNPLNCVVIDEEFREKQQKVVFICFTETRKVGYSFFSKGAKDIEYRNFSKDLTNGNCQEMMKEAIEEIKKEYKVKDFNIYFTINLRLVEVDFFKRDGLEESISLIASTFKRVMDINSVVKYFPKNYPDHLDNFRRGNFRDNPIKLSIRDSKKEYLVFLDKFFSDTLFKELESSIERHEESSMTLVKEKSQIKDMSPTDTFVLSVLDRMNGNLRDGLTLTQGRFLVKIWEFLMYKEDFYNSFISLFDTVVSKEEMMKLEEIFDLFFDENMELFTFKGLVIAKQIESPGQKYYSLISAFIPKDTPLGRDTIAFISRLFTVLVKHFDHLARIVCSKNQKETGIFSNLRREHFNSYKQCSRKLISDFYSYLQSEAKDTFYGSLAAGCLENILKSKQEDFFVVKAFNDDLFKKYVSYAYSDTC